MSTTVTSKSYPFSHFEPYWQDQWLEKELFKAPNPGEAGFDPQQQKFYVLDMFPYPSGSGLHVGHLLGYTATDIVARYHRMQGKNVLHPMGWDAFGLPAEQYAVKTGQHPRLTTETNIANFKKQLQRLGFSYDWSREISTTDPDYFRWTQSIFLKLYHSWFDQTLQKARPISSYRGSDPDSVRLAYVAEVPVNWCPELGTVLANEEVIEGKSEVGGFSVERRPMRQWMLRITAFANRLSEELEELDWPESIKQLQRNWIGKSEGAEVIFKLDGLEKELSVFTTRPDTLYGITYLVVAPEHPLLENVAIEQQEAVTAYRDACRSKSDLERTELNKEKTGVFSGLYALHPITGEQLPIWVADYVLMSYGSGAVMAVPAHDERDYQFAIKFELPIQQVIEPPHKKEEEKGEMAIEEFQLPYLEKEGALINSGAWSGQDIATAQSNIVAWLEEHHHGKRKIEYKLRDWLFSRQRYWGEPFPIIWKEGKHIPLSEEELPLEPPEMEDFKPTGTTEPPLAKATEWVRYSEEATRELNTMPQWAGSCWYYLRFCDPNNHAAFLGKEAEHYWRGDTAKPGMVDLYVGGTEHAVLHLLYARFWHKLLFDLGEITAPEPFQRLVNQGMILGPDGQKMSKSRGNVINPDQVIEEYGADALRLYEMFMGPLEQTKPWSTTGVEGVYRFLGRVWRLALQEERDGSWCLSEKLTTSDQEVLTPQEERLLHLTIKKVTEDIEAFSFNTALSQMMILVNEFTKAKRLPYAALATLLQLLHPFAPHLTEELWHRLQQELGEIFPRETFLMKTKWPQWKESSLQEKEVTYVLQVNGKVRAKMMASPTLDQATLEEQAQELPNIQSYLTNATLKKVIFVPKKLLNFVITHD